MLPNNILPDSFRIVFQVILHRCKMMDKLQFYADLGMDASNLNNTDVRVKVEHRIKIVTADFTRALNQATENIKAMSKD